MGPVSIFSKRKWEWENRSRVIRGLSNVGPEKATGIYFALPTQLTSNKIYDRFNAFLHQIVSTETPQHALLLHSGARLMDTEMGRKEATVVRGLTTVNAAY